MLTGSQVERLRMISNGSIGIGTAAPTAKLAIVGNVGIGTLGVGDFYTSTLPPAGGMIIEGNVGIGTITPGAGLDVGSTKKIRGGLQARIVSIADATSISVNADTTDIAYQLNTQSGGTLTVNNPTGTPLDGQLLTYRIKCTNVQTFSWDTQFRGSTALALTTATSGSSKYDYLGFRYNAADTKWDQQGSNLGF